MNDSSESLKMLEGRTKMKRIKELSSSVDIDAQGCSAFDVIKYNVCTTKAQQRHARLIMNFLPEMGKVITLRLTHLN